MFTQPRYPNNKHKPPLKKHCSYCLRTIHSISACFKNIEKIKTKETHRLDLNLYKNHLYNTFAPLLVKKNSTDQINLQTPLIDTVVEVRHVIVIPLETCHHKRDRFHSRDRYRYDRTTTPPQFNRSRYDNYRQNSCSYRSPYRSSYKSPYTSRYRSHSYSMRQTISAVHFVKYTSF